MAATSATPQLLGPQQCSYCGEKKQTTLANCAGCKVVCYCSKEHQVTHWPAHKDHCIPVKKARKLMNDEETKLRNRPGDFMTPANPFNQPGHFWGWVETRPYMQAKASLIRALQDIRTFSAIENAHSETMDVFHLNRSDNMGMRDAAPALMLRLGKDQEAYDFIKWHATTGNESNYDWGNMDLPFLNLHGEDVFEPVQPLVGDEFGMDLSHLVALTLLKLRLLLDLHSLKNSMEVAQKLPQELVDQIRETLVSDVVTNNTAILQEVRDGVDISARRQNIRNQMTFLFDKVWEKNAHYWPAVINPGRHLKAMSEYFSHGNEAEMQVVLQHNYASWEETPGAIDWVRDRLEE